MLNFGHIRLINKSLTSLGQRRSTIFYCSICNTVQGIRYTSLLPGLRWIEGLKIRLKVKIVILVMNYES